MDINQTEREAIILNSAWEMIDGMVNWEMFEKFDCAAPTNLMFKNQQNALLFNILLGDFLSQIGTRGGALGLEAHPSSSPDTPKSDFTFIYHLRKVSADPKLGADATVLDMQIETFAQWLEGSFVARGVYLPTIGIETKLTTSRFQYIRMCGDIAKHNLGRLSVNADKLRKLLKASGHDVGEQQAYLAIEDFFKWFHDDIFIYHSSQIAEFLNNIRWAIFEYLEPEFQRSWHSTENATRYFPEDGYKFPDEINDPLARSMYWDSMNKVRSKPWVDRFEVSDTLKCRY